jgi:cytochrome P450
MTLEKGTRVHLSIGAANRDPAQFENPDRLDITRFPNAHFAFASGVHRCLGEKLAKIEARIAIGGFIQRFPDYKVLEDKMVRSPRARFRGFIEVPCVVRP